MLKMWFVCFFIYVIQQQIVPTVTAVFSVLTKKCAGTPFIQEFIFYKHVFHFSNVNIQCMLC